MGKQVRNIPREKPLHVSYDRMAESLVARGLASPLILDKPHRRPMNPDERERRVA